jgi:hypothetical protein
MLSSSAPRRPRSWPLACFAELDFSPVRASHATNAAAALTKALATAEPRSSHGQLLIAALTPAAAPRPAAESAVRMLLRCGQVPTAVAVAARIAKREQHERAMVARARAQRHAVALHLRDGPDAAALVAKHWEARGHGPTWHELGHAMGWPY